jgi:hypothetical protein
MSGFSAAMSDLFTQAAMPTPPNERSSRIMGMSIAQHLAKAVSFLQR